MQQQDAAGQPNIPLSEDGRLSLHRCGVHSGGSLEMDPPRGEHDQLNAEITRRRSAAPNVNASAAPRFKESHDHQSLVTWLVSRPQKIGSPASFTATKLMNSGSPT
jgi:hypothetical protein